MMDRTVQHFFQSQDVRCRWPRWPGWCSILHHAPLCGDVHSSEIIFCSTPKLTRLVFVAGLARSHHDTASTLTLKPGQAIGKRSAYFTCVWVATRSSSSSSSCWERDHRTNNAKSSAICVPFAVLLKYFSICRFQFSRRVRSSVFVTERNFPAPISQC